MQLKTKSKGSLNCVGVIKANDKRAKKYRAIWRENGKQKSKGFENYEDAVKFRKYIELELINNYVQELETQVQELNDDAIWWVNRYNAVQRDYKNLQQRIDKAIELLKGSAMFYCEEDRQWLEELFKRILEILGDKENEIYKITRKKQK